MPIFCAASKPRFDLRPAKAVVLFGLHRWNPALLRHQTDTHWLERRHCMFPVWRTTSGRREGRGRLGRQWWGLAWLPCPTIQQWPLRQGQQGAWSSAAPAHRGGFFRFAGAGSTLALYSTGLNKIGMVRLVLFRPIPACRLLRMRYARQHRLAMLRPQSAFRVHPWRSGGSSGFLGGDSIGYHLARVYALVGHHLEA